MTTTEWVALVGAFGFGAVATKLLDVLWLQRVMAAGERAKWLREQRYRAYGELTREIVAGGPFHYGTEEREILRMVADALLLTEDLQLQVELKEYLPEALAARRRIDQLTNNGTSTIEERTALQAKESQGMCGRGERIVQRFRDTI